MPNRIQSLLGVFALVFSTLTPSAVAQPGTADMPRMPDGRPDLSGTYDTATLTPLERPAQYGNQLSLTEEEAAAIAAGAPAALAALFNIPPDRNEVKAPPREAPPVGGDGSTGPAGNVGGYNTFWLDPGSGAFRIDGRWRTSIITDPANGRRPPMTPEGQQRAAAFLSFFRPNTGTAWWIENDLDAPGPYDDPELRPLSERCVLGFGSTSGPPMLPVLYNNLKQIVQTDDYVMILVEMVHDARIIRLNQEHAPQEIRKWMGDSVGHWEGDTLVVDTTNFGDTPGLFYATKDLHVTERFTRIGENAILYQFTVEDPAVWTKPWSGEYPWVVTDAPMYEYACHEANYSFEGILRGARLLEAEAMQKKSERQQQ